MGKLSLEIIDKHDLPKTRYTPDYDDAGYEVELPSGLVLKGLFMCNGEPCDFDSLEGLDGYIYIQTEEELVELINLGYEELLDRVSAENKDFKRDDYE